MRCTGTTRSEIKKGRRVIGEGDKGAKREQKGPKREPHVSKGKRGVEGGGKCVKKKGRRVIGEGDEGVRKSAKSAEKCRMERRFFAAAA